MTENTNEEMNSLIAETRLQELIYCARTCAASEIKILPSGIEITIELLVPTPLVLAAVSLQNCYPEGRVFVVVRQGTPVLCVYYKRKA